VRIQASLQETGLRNRVLAVIKNRIKNLYSLAANR